MPRVGNFSSAANFKMLRLPNIQLSKQTLSRRVFQLSAKFILVSSNTLGESHYMLKSNVSAESAETFSNCAETKKCRVKDPHILKL